jgi:hypothetical protein
MTDRAANKRPVFVIRVRAEPEVDSIRALRAFLKIALRRFGLRAVSVDKEADSDT